MVLVDDKVRDRRFKLGRDRHGDRAGADMGLDADVVKMRVVADLFALGDAAAVADVRLRHEIAPDSINGRKPQRVNVRSPVARGMLVFAAIFSKTLLLSGVAARGTWDDISPPCEQTGWS